MQTCFFHSLILFYLVTRGTESPPISEGIEGREPGEARSFAQGIVFRWCPPGTCEVERFDKFSITNGYWLGETEVTQEQWLKLMGTTPWSDKDGVKEGLDFPATYVSYDDVVVCCKKVTSQERKSNRLPNGWKYSLPTEAQWEYGCRAGTKTSFSFGENVSQLSDHAWFDMNAWDIGEKYAHRVGQKKSNDWGLRDMHGNVWEWCSDWYGNEMPGGTDPRGPKSGLDRVGRGGSWSVSAAHCRSTDRIGTSPDYRGNYLGFRLALAPE